MSKEYDCQRHTASFPTRTSSRDDCTKSGMTNSHRPKHLRPGNTSSVNIAEVKEYIDAN